MMAVELVVKSAKGLQSLVFDREGHLFVGAQDGRLNCEEEGYLTEQSRFLGPVAGIAVDGEGSLVVASGTSLMQLRQDGTQQVLVQEYEGRRLLGPRAVAVDGGGRIFFTDSGPSGTTSLLHPRGSLFMITGEGEGVGSRLLLPLCHEALAQPTGVAVDAQGLVAYVCEQSANRILRLHQRPVGCWHVTVWHQFAGRLGPSAVAYDDARGVLYVARPELPELSDCGLISVISTEGVVLRELELPGGHDISGLALSPVGVGMGEGQQGRGAASNGGAEYLVYTCGSGVFKLLL